MSRKNRRKRRPVKGTGVGLGHGGSPNLAIIERPLSGPERQMKLAKRLEPDLKGYSMGGCTITIGTSALGHHLSIAHRKRYPTWDEVARARYELLPADLSFGMVFPPDEEHVDWHKYCFHLWEITGLKEARKLSTLAPK